MIPNPVYDFKIKVTDFEFLYCSFLQFQFFRKALSNILRSTISIPVHGLKVKVTDFEFFVLNFYRFSFCKAFDWFESCLVWIDIRF